MAPLFVREGIDDPQPIPSLPGVVQHTRESLRKEVRELADLGIPAVVLFGVPLHKDATGSQAWDPNGIVQVALRDLHEEMGDRIVLIADLCLDEYTDHGHCGVLTADGEVDNDETIGLYARTAIAQAEAGADVVAPSGMMDGQVGAIRTALDTRGYESTSILAYSAKYASALYGPFRDAVDVQIVGGGDRKGYQQDWHNGREALEEVRLDIAEGADIVMVKPALAYLDVIAAVRAARRCAGRGVSRVGRVRDDQGGGRERLDRRSGRRTRARDRDQAGRRGHHPHVPRARPRRDAVTSEKQ